MEKRQELYRGKAKTVYATDDPHCLVMHYRDDVSAFDGAKLAKLDRKGETNNRINAFVMGELAAAGIRTHFISLLNERESLVKAIGIGLATSLASLDFTIDDGGGVTLAAPEEIGADRWQFGLFAPGPKHRLAVAARRSPGESPQLILQSVPSRA